MRHSHGYSKDSSGAGAWEKVEQEGIDMTAQLANLNRTVLERMRNYDRALALALTLRQAWADRYDEFRESPGAPD